MPKQTILSADLSILPNIVSPGTYTTIFSLSVNAIGQIYNISTYSGAVSVGGITSITGTAGQILVSPSTGIVQIDLATSALSANQFPIQSITIDPYGRIFNYTTATVVSGTYNNISSLTVDTQGRVSKVITTSSFFSLVPVNLSGTTQTNATITGTTYINQTAEILYVFTTPQSGTLTLDLNTATSFYFVPSGDFTFSFQNVQRASPRNPAKNILSTISIIVDNPVGYRCLNDPNTSLNFYWIGGIQPIPVPGRTEIYTFAFYDDGSNLLTLGSMGIYG